MTVSLKSNFFANARGFTFEDSASVTWSFNTNTNQLTATSSGGGGGGGVTSLASAAGTITFSASTGAVNADLPTQGGVTPGSYTFTSITVDAYGRITAIATGSPPAGTVTSITAGTGLTGGTINTSGTIAVDLTYSPTMTGSWTFTPGSGIGIKVNSKANADGISVKGASTTGQSYGIGIQAGTSPSDGPLYIETYAGSQILDVTGDGGIQVGTPTGGSPSIGAINAAEPYQVNGVVVTGTVQVQLDKGAGWNSSSGALNTSSLSFVDVIIPYACTLQEVDIDTAGGTGSCVVNVWKIANRGTPTSANDITGGVSPAISSATQYTNTTLSGWTTAFAQNDKVRFTLASVGVFTEVLITLRLK